MDPNLEFKNMQFNMSINSDKIDDGDNFNQEDFRYQQFKMGNMKNTNNLNNFNNMSSKPKIPMSYYFPDGNQQGNLKKQGIKYNMDDMMQNNSNNTLNTMNSLNINEDIYNKIGMSNLNMSNINNMNINIINHMPMKSTNQNMPNYSGVDEEEFMNNFANLKIKNQNLNQLINPTVKKDMAYNYYFGSQNNGGQIPNFPTTTSEDNLEDELIHYNIYNTVNTNTQKTLPGNFRKNNNWNNKLNQMNQNSQTPQFFNENKFMGNKNNFQVGEQNIYHNNNNLNSNYFNNGNRPRNIYQNKPNQEHIGNLGRREYNHNSINNRIMDNQNTKNHFNNNRKFNDRNDNKGSRHGDNSQEEGSLNLQMGMPRSSQEENTNYIPGRYFVIKSLDEDNIHKSIKYRIWCSTIKGNQKLQKAFKEADNKYPIYLFFSVNGSGRFLGLAQMTSEVEYRANFNYWTQNEKWKGFFFLVWLTIKDIPNRVFRNIINEYNENKPVTASRDTQEIHPIAGAEMHKIFSEYAYETSILDDFKFYEQKQDTTVDSKIKTTNSNMTSLNNTNRNSNLDTSEFENKTQSVFEGEEDSLNFDERSLVNKNKMNFNDIKTNSNYRSLPQQFSNEDKFKIFNRPSNTNMIPQNRVLKRINSTENILKNTNAKDGSFSEEDHN